MRWLGEPGCLGDDKYTKLNCGVFNSNISVGTFILDIVIGTGRQHRVRLIATTLILRGLRQNSVFSTVGWLYSLTACGLQVHLLHSVKLSIQNWKMQNMRGRARMLGRRHARVHFNLSGRVRPSMSHETFPDDTTRDSILKQILGRFNWISLDLCSL